MYKGRRLWQGSLLVITAVLWMVSVPIFASSKDVSLSLNHAIYESNNHYETAGSGGALFVISGKGNLRFLQTFFYSDASCTTLLGMGSITDNGSGRSFANGSTLRLSPSTIYQLADNQGITTADIACMKVFLNGGNQSSRGVDCQSFTDLTCTASSCSSQQVKYVNWVFKPDTCAKEHAYVTSKNESTVTMCEMDSVDGSLAGCAQTGDGFKKAAGAASNNGYVSITDEKRDALIKCRVNASTGLLENCADTGSGFSNPFAILYNDGYIYIASNKNNSVIKCKVDPKTGVSSLCASTGSGFSKPLCISMSNSYAYVVNSKNKTILKCFLNHADGSLSDCADAGGSFKKPVGIALSNGFAYIGDQKLDVIFKCTVSDADGSFSDCVETGSDFKNPVGIAINSNGYAYIGNEGNSTVSKCTVDEVTGALSECVSTGSGFNGTREICFS